MNINKDELYSLVKSLSEINVSELMVKNENLTIKIKHSSNEHMVCETASNDESQQIENPQEEIEEIEGIIISAPIHGTFYAASGPDDEPFIKVGDRVKKGQTICILEAMKMMNTINIPENGIITSIDVDNEDIVDAGQVLVRYMPD